MVCDIRAAVTSSTVCLDSAASSFFREVDSSEPLKKGASFQKTQIGFLDMPRLSDIVGTAEPSEQCLLAGD